MIRYFVNGSLPSTLWCLLLSASALLASCGTSTETGVLLLDEHPITSEASTPDSSLAKGCGLEISDYIRCVFEDSRGVLWIDTHGRGVARYDGDSLQYFTAKDGFGGMAIREIAEDAEGNVWFATSSGVTRYAPLSQDDLENTLNPSEAYNFTNYTISEGLSSHDVRSLVIDQKGNIWVGTTLGLCSFTGNQFAPIQLADWSSTERNTDYKGMIRCITVDSQGRLWLGTDKGVYLSNAIDHAGEEFTSSSELTQVNWTHLSESAGLCANKINDIVEDENQRMWFASQNNGVCSLSDHEVSTLTNNKETDDIVLSFASFDGDGSLMGKEISRLYLDTNGHLWISSIGHSVYRYTPNERDNGEGTLTHFNASQGLTSNAINCFYEDSANRFWLGGWRGLFRYDSSPALSGSAESFAAVNRNGPWE